LSVRAETDPSTVEYVEFYVGGTHIFTDYSSPYSMGDEDGGGNYNPVAQLASQFSSVTLEAIPFLGGVQGTSYSIQLSAEEPTAVPTTPSPTAPPSFVSKFFLVDTTTGSDIHELTDGNTIIALPNLSLRAETDPSTVEYVEFYVGGTHIFTDYSSPYSMGDEDGGGNYNPVAQLASQFSSVTLEAIPFLGGVQGTSYSIQLNAEEPTASPTTLPPSSCSVTKFFLVDTTTGSDIQDVLDNADITASPKVTLRVETDPPTLDYVDFYSAEIPYAHSGETAIPYSIAGKDAGTGNYNPWSFLEVRSNAVWITATPYSGGVAGTPLTVKIKVKD